MVAVDIDQLFADLITRIRGGDHAAAEELVRKYEPVVRRAIRLNMTDSRMAGVFDSVDVCQSIWRSFFVRTAAGQFDINSPAQLVGLLIAMAKNKLAYEYRRNRTQKRDVGRVAPNDAPIERVTDHQPSPSDCVSANELFDKMQSTMTDEERRLSELRKSGLPWEEVARIVGGTAQSCRMRLQRAADRVTRELGLDE
jgi:RNA polymerase sigma factor (sigma-70 family)